MGAVAVAADSVVHGVRVVKRVADVEMVAAGRAVKRVDRSSSTDRVSHLERGLA